MGIVGSLLLYSDETLEGKGKRWQARLLAARRVTRLLCFFSTTRETPWRRHTHAAYDTPPKQANSTQPHLSAMCICATCRGVKK